MPGVWGGAAGGKFVEVDKKSSLRPAVAARAVTTMTRPGHTEPMQEQHPNVFTKEYVIVCSRMQKRRSHDGKV